MTKVRTRTTPACTTTGGDSNLGEVLNRGNDGAGLQIKNIADPTDDQDAATKKYVDDEIAADQHFRGTYISLVALQTAIPTGNPGDYADVDAGVGTDVQRYIWDDDDEEWIEGGGASSFADLTGQPTDNAALSAALAAKADKSVTYGVACSDLTTAITTGAGKGYFRVPYAGTITAVKASLFVQQTSGSLFTIDINKNNSSILSTKLTFNNASETTVGAATPPVISDTALTADDELQFDVDQVGDGTAKGLIVYVTYTRS